VCPSGPFLRVVIKNKNIICLEKSGLSGVFYNVPKNKLEDWVFLSLVSAEYPRSAWNLIKTYPRLEVLRSLTAEELNNCRLEPIVKERLLSPQIRARVHQVLETASRLGVAMIPIDDEKYPECLREIFDPPFLLYARGDINLLHQPGVALVGTRNASLYGLRMAERLADDLAGRGLVIISGLARGIDTAAHRGALKSGSTVAVFGSSLDWIYPRQNRSLAEKITSQGLILSEYPFQTHPARFHFPLRNRIIAGLSLACIVVEAAQRSGSLITARLALDQNREVMAVPGNVTSEVSQGTNWLIRSGAKLVQTWEDVVEELPEPWRSELMMDEKDHQKKSLPSLTPEEEIIYKKLSFDNPCHVDELIEETNRSTSELLAIMLNLELKGYVQPLAGKYFIRRE
jgi:DNA processing protein